jgi:hypothetical protein
MRVFDWPYREEGIMPKIGKMIWVMNREPAQVAGVTAGLTVNAGMLVTGYINDGPSSVKNREVIISLDQETVAKIIRLACSSDPKPQVVYPSGDNTHQVTYP